ncbi:unnamed protein product [Paramecium sonneborni]|uniref:Uncharacterized protein n=1 Tax=Paramecium sonneborni TaxID=65129 RepID=A0A8S1MGA5_9CILI|nr:unnamed protein product [Paramecium sonneborni]
MIERFKTIKMLEPYLNKPPTEQLIFKLRIYYSLGDITNNAYFKHLKISNFYKQETVCQFCFHVYNKIDSLRTQQLKNKRVILTSQQIEAEVSKFMSQNFPQKEAKVQLRFHSKFFDKLKQFDTDQLKFFQEFTLTTVHDDKYFLKRGKSNRSLQQHQQAGFQLPTIIKVQVNDKDNMIKKTKYLIPKEQAESLGLKHYLGHAKNLPFSDQGLAISKSSLELNKLQDKIREIQMIKERMDQEKIKRVREDIQVIMCTYYGKGKEEKDRLVDFVETLKKREQQLESLEETSQQIRSPAIQIVTDKNDFLSENQRKIKQDKEKKEQEILQTKKDFLEVNSDLAFSVLRKDYVSEHYETDKFFLINNKNGTTQEITKTGDFIKKFSLDYTGKVGFKNRIQQSDPCHYPCYIESLSQFPQFYIPQPDKFDGYAQLPRTLQKPFYNNNRRSRSDATVESAIEFVKQQSFNNKYLIDKPIKHITGTINDFNCVQNLKKIKILEHRKSTKQRNFTNHINSVKIINNEEISAPNLTLLRRTRIKSQLLPKTIPFGNTNSKEPSEIRNLIPLENREIKSIHQFQQYQSEHKESDMMYQSRTFVKSQCQSKVTRNDLHTSHLTLNHFQEKVDIAQKEENAYIIPQQKEKLSISWKGRFSAIKTKSNGDQYVTDRIIMKLFQPDLFK